VPGRAAPGAQEILLESAPERFYRPPYVGHRGWIGALLDLHVDWDEVERLVTEAYRLVAPKSGSELMAQFPDNRRTLGFVAGASWQGLNPAGRRSACVAHLKRQDAIAAHDRDLASLLPGQRDKSDPVPYLRTMLVATTARSAAKPTRSHATPTNVTRTITASASPKKSQRPPMSVLSDASRTDEGQGDDEGWVGWLPLAVCRNPQAQAALLAPRHLAG
jgi:hypothetical protein